VVRAATIVAGVTALCFAALASGGTTSGRIVFAATMPAKSTGNIYVVAPGGKPLDLSTTSAGEDWSPAVSSDGSHIAFLSTRGAGRRSTR
jgi:Tol biopolymer transport system component